MAVGDVARGAVSPVMSFVYEVVIVVIVSNIALHKVSIVFSVYYSAEEFSRNFHTYRYPGMVDVDLHIP